MKRIPIAAALSAATALLAAALVPPASATPQSSATVCSLRVGTVSAGGDLKVQNIAATSPPSVTSTWNGPKGLYQPEDWRLFGSVATEVGVAGQDRHGYVTNDTSLYSYSYRTDGSYQVLDPGSYKQTKIGGGWTRGMTYFDSSSYYNTGGTVHRSNVYALWDGVIWRWSAGWKVTLFRGFDAVKTMTLISATPTYETFLANLKGGSLYMIRIPVASNAVPVVKPVRTRTWQGFETLIAERCGSQSTLLLGIDKDTNSGYLYAVSHANGTATVIKGLGKVTGADFTGVAQARVFNNDLDSSANLNGD
ncbi:hypothetical protein E0H73_16410 [Kribbella pittospori]|uniref:Tachylectin 2 domain-containing protein n=1 Tax=Kribbella pittospori TaxID=722689 RepID=A0A4R0L160_9ACTN|nr:hypothetical protein [Kribbella pittospori]TCC62285.1 hypothetical protein E0H73_16410 [Kribbella pittospori]